MADSIKALASKVPLLTVNAGPRDGARWIERLKEEYTSIIKYVQLSKGNGEDWFQISANKEGTKFVATLTTFSTDTWPQQTAWNPNRWSGTCWFMYNFAKYQFKLEFEVCLCFSCHFILLKTGNDAYITCLCACS